MIKSQYGSGACMPVGPSKLKASTSGLLHCTQVDLFLYGLDAEAAEKKIIEIFHVRWDLRLCARSVATSHALRWLAGPGLPHNQL